MLKLELIILGKLFCSAEIGWLTFLFKLNFFAECVAQTTLDQIDREISDVDPDPLATQLLRSMNGRPASAKRIENNIAGIARRADNALKKCLWFLSWIAEPLLGLRINLGDISPEVLNRHSSQLVGITFYAQPFGFILRTIKSPLAIPLLHLLLRYHPAVWRRLITLVFVN